MTKKVYNFTEGQWVWWHKKYQDRLKGKFRLGWKGPYQIKKVFNNESMQLTDNGRVLSKLANGNHLKPYVAPRI